VILTLVAIMRLERFLLPRFFSLVEHTIHKCLISRSMLYSIYLFSILLQG